MKSRGIKPEQMSHHERTRKSVQNYAQQQQQPQAVWEFKL